MDETYTKSRILFILIIVVLVLGFYKSYFSLFPKFENIPISQHLHTALFSAWFALLFIQPYLIRKGKKKLHRLFANFSYALIPLLVISVFTLAKNQYHREQAIFPESQCIANLIIPLPQISIFVILYILAMVNKKNTPFHIRYMIGTAIVLIGPGLGRLCILWMGMTFSQAVVFCFFVTEILLAGLIFYDFKKGNKFKPYSVLLIMFIFSHLAWYFLPQSSVWQELGSKLVQVCF